jgi:NAD+ kinase
LIAEYQTVAPTSDKKSARCLVHSLLDGTPNNSGFSSLHEAVDMATQISHEDPSEPHRDSRVLSKKQLSDMAFGIRELSKNLAHMKLKLKVQNLFILCKVHDDKVVEDARNLALWLLTVDKQHRVYALGVSFDVNLLMCL